MLARPKAAPPALVDGGAAEPPAPALDIEWHIRRPPKGRSSTRQTGRRRVAPARTRRRSTRRNRADDDANRAVADAPATSPMASARAVQQPKGRDRRRSSRSTRWCGPYPRWSGNDVESAAARVGMILRRNRPARESHAAQDARPPARRSASRVHAQAIDAGDERPLMPTGETTSASAVVSHRMCGHATEA